MHRARRAAVVAFALIWSVAVAALAAPPTPAAFAAPITAEPAVAWPVSSGLLIAEVVTGGASASDEYVELTNAGPGPIDLNGFEVAYASSAGTSATRRVGWSTTLDLDPGRHLLIANSAGIYAAGADATYTAGIAATGGALVLRPAGGAPIDAVAWGDATNGFLEPTPAAAPPAGSSIERRPGGVGGNVADSNDNAADFALNPAPVPENLAAPARPVPGASPSPRPTPSPSPRPTATPSPRPTPSPSPRPTAAPTATPSATPSATPRPSSSPTPSPRPSSSPTPAPLPTPTPTATPGPIPSPTPSPTAMPSPTRTPAPTPTPTSTPIPSPTSVPIPSPTPSPTAMPSPSPSGTTISIAEALARGGLVSIAGVVTVGPMLIDASGRLVVIQDSSAAVEVRLPAANTKAGAGLGDRRVVPGMALEIKGSVGHAYGAPRVTASAVTWLGQAGRPTPLRITSAPSASIEWRLVVASGRLDSIHRLGLRWRADLIVGTTRIPIVGLTGSQILVGRLFMDRRVTLIGVVRRAYPTAIDQRFAIEPRSVSDLSFDRPEPLAPHPTGNPGGGSGAVSGSTGATASGTGTGGLPAGAPTIDLRDLASVTGRLVEAGGIVTRIAGSMVWLDDGTATGRLLLRGDAAPFLDLIEVGDPLEVSGWGATDAAGPYLLVTDPAGVRQAGDPGTDASGSSSPGAAAAGAPASNGPETPAARLIAPGLVAAGAPGIGESTIPGLLVALAIALAGATVAVGIVVPRVRRRVRRGSPGGPREAPPARPTLGPS
jgi:hypothetical protein